jgi:hypothetical protein
MCKESTQEILTEGMRTGVPSTSKWEHTVEGERG